jgi:hypothetical protein
MICLTDLSITVLQWLVTYMYLVLGYWGHFFFAFSLRILVFQVRFYPNYFLITLYAAFMANSFLCTEGWIIVMEIIPGFSLYRGLYEFGQYAFSGNTMGTDGMKWANLEDSENGMRSVLIIMVVEWVIMLPLAFYMDQISSFGGGARKDPLFFLKSFKKRALSLRRYSFGRQGSKVVVEMDNSDATQEVSYSHTCPSLIFISSLIFMIMFSEKWWSNFCSNQMQTKR